MATAKRKSTFERLFSSRTGRKSYFFAVPIAFVMLFFPYAGVIGTILLAGSLASRLNDIGWSRWHAAWLTLWMLLVVTVASAHPAHGATMAQHKAGLGLIELPLFALLFCLGLFPGQKAPNRFGPLPIGFREYQVVQRDARAYRKAYAKIGPNMQKLVVQQNQLTSRRSELQKQMQERMAAHDQVTANALKIELDETLRACRETTAQLKEANAIIAPARAQFEQSRQRIREIADYKSAA